MLSKIKHYLSCSFLTNFFVCCGNLGKMAILQADVYLMHTARSVGHRNIVCLDF